jgi:hypothetical protein
MIRYVRATLSTLLGVGLLSSAASANFLVNGDFSAGNTGFTTSSNYSYISSGFSTAGHYSVISNPGTTFTNGYPSFGDHTTGTGLMEFIDGSPVAHSTFWSETVTLAANTEYSFSGWIHMVSASSTPTIQLLGNSTAIGSTFTAQLSPAIWQNFTETFNSGSATSITFDLVDLNLKGLGNDFAIDDLSLVTAASIPEPQSVLLASLGLSGVFALIRSRRREKGTAPTA